jgi:hypothetical protein
VPFALISGRLDAPAGLRLHGEVTVRDARALAADLAQAAGQQAAVQVESAELEQLDTAVLQVLCALARSGVEVSYPDGAPAIAAAAARRGIPLVALGSFGREES